MIAGSIARRYAKALLQLGIDGKNYDEMGVELARLLALVEGSAELKSALENPVFPHSQRKNIVREIVAKLGVSKVVEHFVLLLLDHNRFMALAAIVREYRLLCDEQAGRVRALLTSARALSPALEGRIKSALERRTGKTVILERREDPSLIGGVTAQIGDLIYDGSVRAQLARVKQELLSE